MRPLELATKPVQVQTSDVITDSAEENLKADGEENIRKISSAMVSKEMGGSLYAFVCFMFVCLFAGFFVCLSVFMSVCLFDADEESLEADGEVNIRKISVAMVRKEIGGSLCLCLFVCLSFFIYVCLFD
jgi:hypothetical protein